MKLKKVIGNSSVVLLGEQTHGDAETFIAKVNLVKFLHEKMGFNVVAFESDMYALEKVNSYLEKNPNEAISVIIDDNLYPIWEESREVKPLFDYVTKIKKTNPLKVTGFDAKHVLKYSRDSLALDLKLLLHDLNFHESKLESEKFYNILQLLIQREYLSRIVVSEEDQYFFLDYLNKIQSFLENHKAIENRLMLFKQLIISIEGFAKNSWSVAFANNDFVLLDKFGNKNGNVRDLYLAKNALWLINERYKNEKIIFWGATFHFTRNLAASDSIEMGINYSGKVTMGDVLYHEIPDEIYSVGFTTYKGWWGNVHMEKGVQINPAKKGSLEELLYRQGIKYSFLDLKKMHSKNKISMRPLGHVEMTADWSNHLDGIFFISELTKCIIQH